MNIAILLAGGIGTRLKSKTPKQLLLIDKKPVFIHTIQNLLKTKMVHQIILVFNKNFINKAQKLINKFILEKNKIKIITGGETRNDSINEAFLFLNKNKTKHNDIIITHDSVRLFFSKKLIKNLIDKAKNFNCVSVPVIPITDSILKITNFNNIEMIDRENLFQIQTPQVLKFKILKKMFESKFYKITENKNWELCWLAKINNISIKTSPGEFENLKLTELKDIKILKAVNKIKKN